MQDSFVIGDVLPVFERTTDFPEWNRYAAVNDEFIDVHMSADAARAAGQPDVFGMGNLRVGYLPARSTTGSTAAATSPASRVSSAR